MLTAKRLVSLIGSITSTLVLAGAIGCGDGAICPSDIVVQIASPTMGATVGIMADGSDQPGIQINVEVRSNLRNGDNFTLTVADTAGASSDFEATADADGNVTFENVTVSGGELSLTVTGASRGNCGQATDTINVTVISVATCDITFAGGSVNTDFFGDIRVLNRSVDADADADDFQGTINVATTPGFEVEVFALNPGAASETSLGTATSDADGDATFGVDLAQGQHVFRATCVSASGSESEASLGQGYAVDTISPNCGLVSPALGAAINPSLDEDLVEDGLQVTLRGNVDPAESNDVEGETTTFTVGALDIEGSAVDGDGNSSAIASFTSPGSVDVVFTGKDRAANECTANRSFAVALEGCEISHVAPIGVQSTDVDGGTGGVQLDYRVDVDPTCAGLMVRTDCDVTGERTFLIPVDGVVEGQITACTEDVCDETYNCESSVTTQEDITTSAGATIEVDTRGPPVVLIAVDPNPLPCGQNVAIEDIDTDGNPANGAQITIQVSAPLDATTSVELTALPGGGVTTVATTPGADVEVTLPIGTTNVQGIALDDLDNESRTVDCIIGVADILVTYDPPIDDGFANRDDGTVVGTDLTLDICGQVSLGGSTVELEIDGGAPVAATVVGNGWCVNNVTIDEDTHTLVASASNAGRVGSATLDLIVDLTPPAAPTGLSTRIPDRISTEASWDAQAVASFSIKSSTGAITDGNFDGLPAGVTVGGALTSATLTDLTIATTYNFGVVAIDLAGNRSTPAVIADTPDFDQSGAISSVGDPNDPTMGWEMAKGDLNNDGFSDVIVSAPNMGLLLGGEVGVAEVAIYLGSTTGLSAAPEFRIIANGTTLFGLGMGLAVLDWNGDGIDDLAVSNPFDGDGEVFIYLGGAPFTGTGTYNESDADVVFSISSTPNFYTNSLLGYSLSVANFDGDTWPGGADRLDLIIATPGAGAGTVVGGAIVVYAGATSTAIEFSSLSNAGMGDANAHFLPNPDAGDTFTEFGRNIFNLGRLASDANGDDIGLSANSQLEDDAPSLVVYRARASQPTGLVNLTFDASQDIEIQDDTGDGNNFFAMSVGTINDQNTDSRRDIVLSAPRQGAGANQGRIYILDGDAAAADFASPGEVNVSDLELARVDAGGTHTFIGQTILQNELADSADADIDGTEDLTITSGEDGATLLMWFGPNIPTGTALSTTSDLSYDGPASFDSPFFEGGALGRSVLRGIWAGDVNGDGFEDICWSDWNSSAADDREGAFEVLFDDGL